MKKKKLPETEEEFQAYLKRFIVASLRRSSLYWPFRNLALKEARIERGMYKCADCHGAFSKKEVRVDHIKPVVKLSGFSGWEDYINRMFPKTHGFQILCLKCNDIKCQEENILRKIKKNIDKAKK